MKLPRSHLLCATQWILPAFTANLELYPRSDPTPSPISVPPSQNWDGDDGPWSSFTILVGTPAQDVRVFISPISDNTLVVSSLGCVGSSDSTCSNDRGGLFNSNTSSTWQQHGYYELDVDQNLNVVAQGVFGNDTVALGIQGSGGPSLQNQIVSAYTANALYVGMFGVNPASTNFTPADQNRASFLSSLKTGNMIPSLSFGYTAGNQYRLKQVYGSLTLGGYDSSLFTPNNVTVPFAPNPARPLLVGVQTIKSNFQNGTETDLMTNGIMMSVDSTVAPIYLPQVVCQHFEAAFNLTLDTKTGLYLVSDDLHTHLMEQNASVTFTLGATVSGGQTVDITLPYASFDLVVKPPAYGVGQSQKYFPLRVAANDTQYTLGRTFFQESYLAVDWERQNFSVSASVFAENNKQNLVAITSASSISGSGSGKTVGIAVGVVVAVVVIAAAIAAFFLLRRRRRRHAGTTGKDREDRTEAIRQGFAAKGELDGHDNQRYEMVGSDPNLHKKAADLDGGSPGWVNEKANYPGDRSGMVEADGGNSARAELVGGAAPPRTTVVRPLHEMHDPSSQPRFELSADQLGELQGSTPDSSTPASPVSSMRRSAAGGVVGRGSGTGSGSGTAAGGGRSPWSKPSSPLSSPSSGRLDNHHARSSTSAAAAAAAPPAGGNNSRHQSRLSFLGALRPGNRSSATFGSSSSSSRPAGHSNRSSQPGHGDGPMTLATTTTPVPPPPPPTGGAAAAAATGRSSDVAAPSHHPSSDAAFSPVSRRGTFERSGTPGGRQGVADGREVIGSPISPQSPGDADGSGGGSSRQGLWERLRR